MQTGASLSMSIKYNDLIPYHVDRARFDKVNMHEGQPFN